MSTALVIALGLLGPLVIVGTAAITHGEWPRVTTAWTCPWYLALGWATIFAVYWTLDRDHLIAFAIVLAIAAWRTGTRQTAAEQGRRCA